MTLEKLFIREDQTALRKDLRSMTSSLGWKETCGRLGNAIRSCCSGRWLLVNKRLLSLFDMEELIGYDGDVMEILQSVPDTDDFNEVNRLARDKMIAIVQEQLERSGSTLFFDIESMTKKATAKVVAEVSKARIHEFAGVLNAQTKSSTLDLLALWVTEYGFRMLRALGVEGIIELSESRGATYVIEYIKKRFTEVEKLDPNASILNGDFQHKSPLLEMSVRLRNLMTSLLDLELKKDLVPISSLTYLHEAGYADAAEFLRMIRKVLTSKIRTEPWKNVDVRPFIFAIREFAAKAPKIAVKELDLMLNLPLPMRNHEDYELVDTVHVECLRKLRDIGTKQAIDVINQFVSKLEWESDIEDGCKSRAGLKWSTMQALKIAEDVMLEHRRSEMANVYMEFKECLRWHAPWYIGELCEWVVDGIVKTQGSQAIGPLLEHLVWNHAKYDECNYEIEIDGRIFNGLVKIGEPAIPGLIDQLEDHELGFLLFDVLAHIGGSAGEQVFARFKHGFHYASSDFGRAFVSFFAKQDHPKALEASLVALNSPPDDMTEDEWFDSMSVGIDESEIVAALSSDSSCVRNGATLYLAKRANSVNSVTAMLDLGASHFQTRQVYFPDRYDDYDTAPEWTFYHLAEAALRIGERAILAVVNRFESSDWTQRACAALTLSTIATFETGEQLLCANGLDEFLAKFFDEGFRLGRSYEEMRDELWCADLPFGGFWMNRAVAIGKFLTLKDGNWSWDRDSVKEEVTASEEPWLVVGSVGQFEELLQDESIVEAIQEVGDRIAMGIESAMSDDIRVLRIVTEVLGIKAITTNGRFQSALMEALKHPRRVSLRARVSEDLVLMENEQIRRTIKMGN